MLCVPESQQFWGRTFTVEEVELIREVVRGCGGISRLELAYTVCELLEWKRPGGGLKARECRDLLERLEIQGILKLPEKRSLGAIQPKRCLAPVTSGQPHSALTGSVEMFAPVDVELVENRQQRDLFQQLVSRYHCLGYAMPYGARLQYWAYVSKPRREMVGCVQVETLVDRQRFHGGCYRAANWVVLGETSGRGRMDRANQRHGASVKTVLVYALVKDATRRLRNAWQG